MDAKLEKIIIKNFGKIDFIEVEIKGSVTRLIGMNGAGKTTIGYTAIVAAFKGIVEKGNQGQIIGQRYQFIGPNGTSSDVIVHIRDVKQNALIEVSNHITATKNGISFKVIESNGNYVLNENWLMSLFNEALLSASNFTQLTSKEQALALGINTEQYDREIKNIKDDFTILNRELKSFGELTPVQPVEKVSATEIYAKLEGIKDKNRLREQLLNEKEILMERANSLRQKIEQLKMEILNAETGLKITIERAAVLSGQIQAPIDEEPVRKELASVESINNAHAMYEEYSKKIAQKKAVEDKVAKNREALEKKEADRLDYIKSRKLPFSNLSVDDNGGLLMNGRQIRPPFWSTGELEKIVAMLAKSQNPNLKLRFIDDFNLVDSVNQEIILKQLTEAGFDVIVADVGDAPKENAILIRNGKVVE